MSEVQLVIDLVQKYGIHFTSYVIAIIFIYRFLIKNGERIDGMNKQHDEKVSLLIKQQQTDAELYKKQINDIQELNRKQLIELMDKYTRDEERNREVFTKSLVLTMETAKQMMETISTHNLTAHKALSDRLGHLEGKVEHISDSIKDLSKAIKVTQTN